MNFTTYLPPYAAPISLLEMKNHLRVDASFSDDDLLIGAQCTAANEVVEVETGKNVLRNKVMLATTFEMGLFRFPVFHDGGQSGGYWHLYIEVPRVPLISVVSITYLDLDGNVQTLDSALYSITDAQRGIISLNYGQSWPNVRFQPNAVIVRFIAGLAASFTADATTNIFTSYGRTFITGDRVQVSNSGGALPAGLAVLTTYFVIAASGSTFQLSLTSGGAAIDITTAGTGTNFLGLEMAAFITLCNAMKLLVGFWYDNRSAVDTGRASIGATILPYAVEALCASQHA